MASFFPVWSDVIDDIIVVNNIGCKIFDGDNLPCAGYSDQYRPKDIDCIGYDGKWYTVSFYHDASVLMVDSF